MAYWTTALASRNLPAVTASLGLLATPVLSVVVATLWLGEPLTLALVAAIGLILGGVAIGATARDERSVRASAHPMALDSAIEWTDATWNPVTGCTKISPGCKFCYAERLTERFGRQPFSEIRLHPERLSLPVRWGGARRIFVNSMSDLFHEKVPASFIGQLFDVMAQAPQHVFQVLTKRPERLLAWQRSGAWPHPIPPHI